MNPFKKHKLTKAIKKAISETKNLIKDEDPKLVDSFFYGAYDIAPQHLVIWYLFKTNNDLQEAKNSGLTNIIIQNTTKVMIENGYPKEAFIDTEFPISKIKFANGTKEQQDSLLRELSHSKFNISFTTLQDIEEKANGDFRMYFQ